MSTRDIVAAFREMYGAEVSATLVSRVTEAAFPHARVQLCLVHMVRHSVKYVSWKDRKAVCRGLKQINDSPTVAEAVL